MRQALSAWTLEKLLPLSGAIPRATVWATVWATASVGCAVSNRVAERVSSVQIDSQTYIVQAGDTIDSVAFRYKLDPNQLAKLNPEIAQGLQPGQPLLVRSGEGGGKIKPAKAQIREKVALRTEVPASYRADPLGSRVVVTAVPMREAPIREIAGVTRENVGVVGHGSANRQLTEEIVEESVSTEALTQPATAPLSNSLGGWQWPIHGEVVREYAPEQINGQGIDIAGVPGQEIKATADGTVIYAGRDLSNSGNLVIVRHSNDVLSTYSHAKDLYVAEDDSVRGGDPIASLGSNSNRESVLHFGVRKSGKPADPLGLLPRR